MMRAILLGFAAFLWVAACVLLIALAGGVSWGTDSAGVLAFIGCFSGTMTAVAVFLILFDKRYSL